MELFSLADIYIVAQHSTATATPTYTVSPWGTSSIKGTVILMKIRKVVFVIRIFYDCIAIRHPLFRCSFLPSFKSKSEIL